MPTRFFELLNMLSEHVSADEVAEMLDDDFVELLQSQGFSRSEIGMAVELAQRLRANKESISPRCLPVCSHQTLAYIEGHRLTAEAKGLVAQLRALELLSPQDCENILEETLLLEEPEIDEEAMRSLVHFYLYTKGTNCPTRCQIMHFLASDTAH
jgi:uncharacterized protein Smg (DUF494 family)